MPTLRQPLPMNGSLGLPDHLLTILFEHVLPDPRCRDNTGGGKPINTAYYYQQLSVLREVCIIWMEVIDSSPTLWALIGSTALNIVESLAKSKSAPLTIRLYRGPFGNDGVLVNWERISGVIPRCDVFEFKNHLGEDGWEGCVLALETSPAPMLRILWLEDYNFDAPIAIDFFRGVAPHLQELFLHHISLKNWGSPFLFNLRELSLIDVTGPTIEQLLAILEACSYLETLRLTLVYIDDNTSGHKPRHTINLLSLHQLAIARLSPAAGNCLLRTIQAPSCRDFLIKPIRDQNPTDIAICSECVNISFRSFLTTAKELSVTISTESFDRIRVTVMEQNNHCPFNVQLNGFSPSSIWSTFVPLLFPETSPAEIELDFRGGSPCVLLDTSAWILPGIRKIILGWEGEKAIERLTFAKMVDGEFRWLWPRLCDMVVDIVSGEKVLQMLVARAGAAMVKRASDNQQCAPVPIKRLVLGSSCTVSSKILKDIRSFVIEVVMHSD